MIRLKSIGIAVAIICSLCLFGWVLTPCVSAQLAIDNDPAENIDATIYVSIDSLTYDGDGEGVADVSGTFYLYNFGESLTYSGELRLEILDMAGNAFLPHSEAGVSGRLEENDEDARLSDIFRNIPKDTNLHMNCLSPKVEVGEEYEMSANIALRVTQGVTETWAIPYSTTFEHEPETDVEQQVGIGPTTDGDTFSDDCKADTEDEWESWESLIYTEGLYNAVYWYVRAPEDTSSLGTHVDTSYGDGATRKATMTYKDFPKDVDKPLWYEITAYVYRWDLSVYTTSYLVWVKDDK